MGSRFTLRRAVTAVAMGAAAVASLVLTGPTASADSGNVKLMRLLDECDSVSFNATFGPGFCVKSGSVSANQFLAALNTGGSPAWWINNRTESIKAGDPLHWTGLNQTWNSKLSTWLYYASYRFSDYPVLTNSGLTYLEPGMDEISAGVEYKLTNSVAFSLGYFYHKYNDDAQLDKERILRFRTTVRF